MQGTTVEIRGCSRSWRWCSPRDRVRDGERTVCPGAGRAAFSKAHPSCPPKTPPLTLSPHPPPLCSFQHPKAFALASQVLAHPLSQPQGALSITLCEVPYFLFIGTHMLSTVISFMSFFPYFFSPKYKTVRDSACTIHLWGARP